MATFQIKRCENTYYELKDIYGVYKKQKANNRVAGERKVKFR